jgi:hypothetical protein
VISLNKSADLRFERIISELTLCCGFQLLQSAEEEKVKGRKDIGGISRKGHSSNTILTEKPEGTLRNMGRCRIRQSYFNLPGKQFGTT